MNEPIHFKKLHFHFDIKRNIFVFLNCEGICKLFSVICSPKDFFYRENFSVQTENIKLYNFLHFNFFT